MGTDQLREVLANSETPDQTGPLEHFCPNIKGKYSVVVLRAVIALYIETYKSITVVLAFCI